MDFHTTPEDAQRIATIASRAVTLAASCGLTAHSTVEYAMALTATHLNGCPLDLAALAEADDYALGHDVFGIVSHLDRDTGELTHDFHPRYALKGA